MRHTVSRLLLAALLGVAATACTYAPRYDDPGPYRYDYYYYPHVGVYFHLYSGHYYYRDGASWVRVRVLPRHIHLDQRVRRALVIREPEPYRRHELHRAQHRPPPDLRHDPARDRAERDHNQRRHQEYLRHWPQHAPPRR